MRAGMPWIVLILEVSASLGGSLGAASKVCNILFLVLKDVQIIWALLVHFRASLVAQRLKPLPSMRETWVRSLGWQDPLEKEMATHSSILAWRIPWMEEPGGLQSTGLQIVGHN